MDQGWISIHRKLLEWEWFSDSNTVHLFMYCLLKANHKPKLWHGVEIVRGQFISSYASISEKTGLSVQNIRTSMNRLKSTGEVTVKITNKYSIISMTNYSQYQDANKLSNSQATVKQQSTNSQLTTNNNENNENHDNNENNAVKNIDGLDVKAFEKYILYRKEAGIKKLTKQGEKIAAKKLVKIGGEKQMQVVDQSIGNGWTGLFELKLKANTDRQSKIDEFNKWMDSDNDNYIDGEYHVVD